MRHTSYIISLLAVAITVLSCDLLDEKPLGQLPSDGFFASPQDLDASLNALYSVVATSHGQNNFTGTNFLTGDDISTHPASNKQPLREYDQYTVSDNNSWMATLWEQRYKVIKAANFIINNASRTPDVSEETKTQAIAQAHFWRAYSYFYLVTTWGSVPVMLEEDIDYSARLWSEEEIYELILSDLSIAESGCPVTYSKAPYTQNGINIAVSQGAVKAAMSYVYMCMAGWPLNKGAEYYELAAAKAEEIIDASDNGTYYYRLNPEFKDIHSVALRVSNPELILGVYYNRDRNPQMTPLTDFLLEMGGWGDTQGEIKFWKEFPEGPRKDATYFPKMMIGGELRDWWYDTDPPSREVVAPCFMKSVEPAARGNEFDYTDDTPCPTNGEKTIQIVRLSQVYCWYAEAVGRSGKVTPKAVEMLNRVRNRADGTSSDIYTTAMTAEELAEAAYDEHGWETAGYYWSGLASRSRDMFRMYRFKDHFEYRKTNPEIEVAPGIFRKEAVSVTGAWDDTMMYSPYPFGDASLNPALRH